MKNAQRMAMDFAALLPEKETPAETEGYEGFFHLIEMKGECESAELVYIIRDHDKEKFEARKALFAEIGEKISAKYGAGSCETIVKDSYYNMKEIIDNHMYTVERAKAAMLAVGVEPRIIPIRGGTDGARLSFMGLPCPNLSTGGINFHSIHEFIPVRSMEKMRDVIISLVKRN
jgi:tripeptide aminopeptidase